MSVSIKLGGFPGALRIHYDGNRFLQNLNLTVNFPTINGWMCDEKNNQFSPFFVSQTFQEGSARNMRLEAFSRPAGQATKKEKKIIESESHSFTLRPTVDTLSLKLSASVTFYGCWARHGRIIVCLAPPFQPKSHHAIPSIQPLDMMMIVDGGRRSLRVRANSIFFSGSDRHNDAGC